MAQMKSAARKSGCVEQFGKLVDRVGEFVLFVVAPTGRW